MKKFLKKYWFEISGALLVPISIIHFEVYLQGFFLSPLFWPLHIIDGMLLNWFGSQALVTKFVLVLLLITGGYVLSKWYKIIFNLSKKVFVKNLQFKSRLETFSLILLNFVLIFLFWSLANLTACGGSIQGTRNIFTNECSKSGSSSCIKFGHEVDRDCPLINRGQEIQNPVIIIPTAPTP